MLLEREERLVDTLINMTDNVIETYETRSGCIWTFDPFLQLPEGQQQVILDTYEKAENLKFCYIVDDDCLEEALKRGITLEKIAFIRDHRAGRTSHKTGKPHEVYYFVWARDPKVNVRVYNRHLARNTAYQYHVNNYDKYNYVANN